MEKRRQDGGYTGRTFLKYWGKQQSSGEIIY